MHFPNAYFLFYMSFHFILKILALKCMLLVHWASLHRMCLPSSCSFPPPWHLSSSSPYALFNKKALCWLYVHPCLSTSGLHFYTLLCGAEAETKNHISTLSVALFGSVSRGRGGADRLEWGNQLVLLAPFGFGEDPSASSLHCVGCNSHQEQ